MLPLNTIAVWQTTMKNNDYRPLVPVNPEGLDAIAESLLNGEDRKEEQLDTKPLKVAAAINKADYIVLPQHSLLIAKYEPDEFKGFKWENKDNPKEGVHYKLRQKGLQMPTVLQLRTHFNNVVESYKGTRKLVDGNGRQLPRNEIEDLYKHLTTNHINNGAWTWLNARFVQGSGFQNMNLERVVAVNADGTLKTKVVPLQPCIWENCYVTFDMNAQGLSSNKSDKLEYFLGENIYFFKPRLNQVAEFVAYSDWAVLDCDGDPTDSYSSLGVFACAKGADAKIGGSN